MHRLAGAAMVAWCFVSLLAVVDRAGAEVVVAINKSSQHMAVLVDGVELHNWKVSTGLGGGPPSGTYGPERLERKWFSHKYGWSPMPHSIFFHEGYAIHGTLYVSRLGRRASHGCVRLHPSNAATLFDLVRKHGVRNTTIVVSNSEYAVKRKLGPKPGVPKPDAVKPDAVKADAVTPANASEITGTVPAAAKSAQ